jgi:leucyl/phenylalanyl-tRNA--protein transferase
MFGSFSKRIAKEAELPFIEENLVNIGGDLSVPTLLRAYQSGCFPWTVNPVTWWSPDPRAIIELDGFHAPRSLLKFLRKAEFAVTIDGAFDRVIEACAEAAPGRKSTWITPEFLRGYQDLHRAGHAHSLEVWEGDKLVGGIYGVAIGGYFAGESMFHRVSNASKAALGWLVEHLRTRGYALFDIQMPTRVTMQHGASLIPREEFLKRMHEAQRLPVTFGTRFLAPD